LDRLDILLRILGVLVLALGVWLYTSSSAITYPLAQSAVSTLAIVIVLTGVFMTFVRFRGD